MSENIPSPDSLSQSLYVKWEILNPQFRKIAEEIEKRILDWNKFGMPLQMAVAELFKRKEYDLLYEEFAPPEFIPADFVRDIVAKAIMNSVRLAR